MAHILHHASPRASVTNSLTFKIAALLVVLFVRLVSVADLTANIVPFKSPHGYMIVVDVRVNGHGPYPFLFDTGATSSVVDPGLSSSLHLAAAQGAKLASWEGTVDARRVLVQSLSFGSISSGPLTVLVQPLSEFKVFDPTLRGVIGQDVLHYSNFLIDNRHHRIQVDVDGTLLAEFSGDRISIAPVHTRAGGLEPRLISVPVRMNRNGKPLHLLLDSGADMLLLQPTFSAQSPVSNRGRWMTDENGRLSSAVTVHARLSVGSAVFSVEAWIGVAGLNPIVIDGLLPTGGFSLVYIANRGSFIMIEPRRKPSHTSELAAVTPGPLDTTPYN